MEQLDQPVTWNDLDEKPICHWVPETYPTPIQKGGPMEAYKQLSQIKGIEIEHLKKYCYIDFTFLSSVHNSS